MAEDKNYVSRSKTINGKKYTVLYTGVEKALEAEDYAIIDGRLSLLRLSRFIFDNGLIVEPSGLKFEDFDCKRDLDDVMGFAYEVITGNFRKKERGRSKGSSEK